MKFTLFAIVAIACTQAIKISDDAADNTDYTYKKVTSDPTGTYSPKDNMHTGFEGSKTGNAYTYTSASTGGHYSMDKVPSTISNHRNLVNEGSSHQYPSL